MFDSTVNTIAPCNTTFAEAIYGHDIPEGRYGYRLLGDRLVPLSFLRDVEIEVFMTTFDATTVYSPRDMVGEAFYQGLSPAEQAALPASLFQLIGEGRIAFTFPE